MKTSQIKASRNVVYVSHGGGPMPLLGDPEHQEMVTTLKTIATQVGKPSAILVISAHWEARLATVTSGSSPGINYDYGGFPTEAYDIQYPCLGEPELAQKVMDAIKRNGIDVIDDKYRRFDHGVFVPLKIMYPEADIPCVQLSLVQTLEPELHIKIGQALQDLDWSNLLVIGSGFSFHNMRAFFTPDVQEIRAKNLEFDDWLKATMSDTSLSETMRKQRLIDWESAPSARFCHPREEHLMPLHVCYGMAGKASDNVYQIEVMRKQASMFSWAVSND